MLSCTSRWPCALMSSTDARMRSRRLIGQTRSPRGILLTVKQYEDMFTVGSQDRVTVAPPRIYELQESSTVRGEGRVEPLAGDRVKLICQSRVGGQFQHFVQADNRDGLAADLRSLVEAICRRAEALTAGSQDGRPPPARRSSAAA